MLAFFNVGSVSAPNGRHDEFHLCLRKPEWERPERAERGARHVRQSVEFRGAGRGGVRQRGQYSCLGARRPVPGRRSAAISNQLMVTADERRREYVRVSDLDFLRHRSRPARANRPSGVSGAPSTAQTTATVNSRSRIRALCCSGWPASRRRLAALPATGTATYTGHAIANIANPDAGLPAISPLARFRPWPTSEPARARSRSRPRRNELYRHGHAGLRATTTFGSGSPDRQYRRPDRSARRLVLPGRPNQHRPRLTARWVARSS